jgi:hypothetical protein
MNCDEEAMRPKVSAVLLSGLIAAALGFAAPAQAAPKKRVYYNGDRTVMVTRDENGRTRTRIIVQRRSFLDPGPELLPGERKFTDYIYPPGYSPTAVIDRTMGGGIRSPLPGPWDLPGRDNPYPWWP